MGNNKREPIVEEIKDKAGDHRLRVTAHNGNILTSSPEGYKNKQDCIDSSVTSSIAILKKYNPELLK